MPKSKQKKMLKAIVLWQQNGLLPLLVFPGQL